MNPKRETAIICRISDILGGHFVKTEGWNPSYMDTPIGKVSRANIAGVVVSKDEQGAIIDDGSGKILLRSFEQQGLDKLRIGDFVLVIGRPRAYQESKYLVPEIIKPIEQRWGEYRKVQLGKVKPLHEKKEFATTKVVVDQQEPNPYQRIIDFVKDLDGGEGADIDVVIERSGLENPRQFIVKLLEEGEIFEIKPGKLKIL